MDSYKTKSIEPAHVDTLQHTLEQLKVPHSVSMDGGDRILRIGPDGEYEVSVAKRRRGGHAISIGIRYEQPVLKNLLDQWLEKCGGQIEEDFFKWHAALSPSVIHGIKARWCVDLEGLPATPVKIGQSVVVFMFERNVERELSEQLAMKPHRRLEQGEFIECADFKVSAEDPNEPVVYGWRSEAGSQLYVVTSSAPALTLLTLWVIPDGAAVEVRVGALPALADG